MAAAVPEAAVPFSPPASLQRACRLNKHAGDISSRRRRTHLDRMCVHARLRLRVDVHSLSNLDHLSQDCSRDGVSLMVQTEKDPFFSQSQTDLSG